MPFRHHILILAYASIMLLACLNSGTALSRHEVYAAQPAREMVDSGRVHAVQTFAGEPRTNKPPTMSWLIAGSMKIFGSREEWVCRLPSALGGVLTAWAVGMIACRLLNPTAGLLAGLISVTMVWLQIQSRLAEADMLLVASVTIAMLALLPPRPVPRERVGVRASASNDPSEAADPHPALPREDTGEGISAAAMLFWSATAIGFLLKMVAIFITIPAAILFAFWARDARVKRILRNPWGIAVFLILFASWPIFAYIEHPAILHDWWAQTIPRLAGRVDQREPITGVQYFQEFFYHFWQIPWLLLPATPVVAIAFFTGFDRWRTSTVAKFLISWVAPFLLVITLTAYKSKHYSFPLLPAFSVAAAYGTMVWMRSTRYPRLVMPLLIAWFVGCAAVAITLKIVVLPKTDSYRGNVEFAEKVNLSNPDGQPLNLIGIGEDPITFYLNPTPHRIDDPAKTPTAAPVYAVSDLDALEILKKTHSFQILREAPDRRKRPKGERLVFIRVN